MITDAGILIDVAVFATYLLLLVIGAVGALRWLLHLPRNMRRLANRFGRPVPEAQMSELRREVEARRDHGMPLGHPEFLTTYLDEAAEVLLAEIADNYHVDATSDRLGGAL